MTAPIADPLPTQETGSMPQASPRADTAQPLRLVLVGCGAIAQQMHLPVLAGHEGIRLVALVDRDFDRASTLARGYGVPQACQDVMELLPGSFEAAILATPPAHHAPGAISLLKRGVHVLVEKPMATCLADAQAMCAAAQASGAVLAVGFFRRFFPSIRLMRGLLRTEAFGRPLSFAAEGGGMHRGSALTLAHMRRDQAGGGVLIDFGSHVLDLLLFLFDEPAEVLQYEDNSLGGVEADCRLRLVLTHAGRPLEGSVELARTRELGNFVAVECERARLEFSFTERFRVRVVPRPAAAPDAVDGASRGWELAATWAGEPQEDVSWYDTFRLQIDDWLEAIRTGRRPLCDGRSALGTARIIDACYSMNGVGRLPEPWVWEGVAASGGQSSPSEGAALGGGALPAEQAASGPPPAAVPPGVVGRRGRVLVTGATGFIGARVAELLHLREGWQVRALVHNPGSAARLARLPVELVQGDLKDAAAVRRLVEGCQAVVHCAVGTAWGQRREIFAVTVGGTRHLAEAASAAGARLVHLSTMSVYGDDLALRGTIDESRPLSPQRGSEYGESKAAAERAVLEVVGRGLEAVILRPARVYGPFSRIFIQRPVPAIARRSFRWLGNPDVPADMVYVDNVVAAILAALAAPSSSARGDVYNVGEESRVTWREFYEYFARRMGVPLVAPVVERGGGALAEKERAAWYDPLAWWRGMRQIVSSPEFKGLGRRVLATPPVGLAPRWALERFPGVERTVRRLIGADDALPVYRRLAAAEPDWVEMGSGGAVVSIAKARRMLGYDPPVGLERGLERTWEWLTYARLV